MKRKLTAALLIVLAAIFALFSCGDKGGGGDTAVNTDTVTFAKGETVTVVAPAEIHSSLEDICSSLASALGKQPLLTAEIPEGEDNILFVGDLDSPLSRRAASLVRRREDDEDNGYTVRVAVFSDGRSVAVAFGECESVVDHLALTAETALARFAEDFVSPESDIHFEKGFSRAYDINILEEERSLFSERQNAAWQRILGQADEATVYALREMYGLFDPDMLGWLADLYDPDIGGFYYSNSGRNFEGYLPDVESTSQAIDLLRLSGALDEYGDDPEKALPESFKKQLISFVKSLQDPSGYFYHPQWTRAMVDSRISRRSRDLTKALSLLAYLGASPTYDVLDVKGDGILWDGTPVGFNKPMSYGLTGVLGESTVTAVSRVTSVAAAVPSNIASKEAFISYLSGLDLQNDSYTVGNDLASQSAEIKARDAYLASVGADYRLTDILKDWLFESCYETTGHWSPYANYDGLNGFMKISAACSSLGIPLRYPEAAARSAINAITTDEYNVTVCYAYNTWFSLNNIFGILDKCHPEAEAKLLSASIREELRRRAPELISATMEKQSIFLRDDGSFSYTEFSTSPTSQGMPVAVPGMLEGDINATLICLADTCHQMFSALGYEMPPIFGKADLTVFLDRIADLGTIVKDEEQTVVVSATFDEETLGGSTSSLVISNSTESSFTVVKDPRTEKGGRVLEFGAVAGGGKRVRLPMDLSVNALSRCYVFEGEFCFLEAPTGMFATLQVGPNCYLISFACYDGTVYLYEQTSDGANSRITDLKTGIPLGEWFSVKVEYYYASAEELRIKLYVGGELINVSDGFFDRDGERLDGGYAAPESRYEGVDFFVYSYYGARVLLDDWACYKKTEQYTPVLDPEDQPTFNIDSPDRDEIIYGFEDDGEGGAPASVNASGAVEVVSEGGNKRLSVGGSAFLSLPVNKRTAGANATALELDLGIAALTEGKIFSLTFREDGIAPHDILKYNFEIEDRGGEKYLVIYTAPTGVSDASVDGISIPVGEAHRLRVEYYDIKRVTLFYLDSALAASSDVTCQDAKKYTVGKIELSFEKTASLTLDNIISEKIKKNFDSATKPAVDPIVYGFETGIGVEYSGGVSLVGGTNKYISLAGGAVVTFPVNHRSVITNLVSVSMDASVSAAKSVGYLFSLKDKDERTVLAFEIRVKDGQAAIHEVTERGAYSEPLCYIARDKVSSLSVLYYPQRETVYFLSGNVAVANSSLYFSEENKLLIPEYLTVSSLDGSGSLTLDNVRVETTAETFIPREISDGINPEDKSDPITFEGSSNGNLPTRVTSKLQSSGAELAVREIIRNGEYSKALRFSTRPGRQDALSFGIAEAKDNYGVTVFEADLRFSFKPNKISSFQIFLEDGDSSAYIINLNKDGDGLTYSDLSSLGEVRHRGSNKRIEGAEEWHNIRIEYYGGTRETVRIKTYVDGVLVRVSNIFGGCEIEGKQPLGRISSVRIMSYGDTYADLLVDNVSFIRADIECKDDPLTDSFAPIEPDDPVDPDPEPDPEPEEPEVEILDKLPSGYGVILENGMKVDVNYYPGFVRKALTFTIDDGNLESDRAFLDIVRPAGIKGTFNLCGIDSKAAAEYLLLYKGYEVANHHRLHCLPWRDDFDYSGIEIKDEIFNSATADGAYMYKTNVQGLYYIDYRQYEGGYSSAYWHPIATNDTYLLYIDLTAEEIEAVFGEGAVVGFAYPHGKLTDTVKQYLKDSGYLYARKTGLLLDTTGFALPEDRFAWTYNANHTNLLEMMARYEAYSDDGELKMFSFGVHSVDYNGSWDMLSEFAAAYGGRPDEFYYATNREIFEYEDAIKALDINSERIINNSSVTVYITVNDTKVIIPAGMTLLLSEIENEPPNDEITFEGDAVGELPERVTSNKNDKYSHIRVVTDPRSAAEKVLEFYKANTAPDDDTYVKSWPVVTVPKTGAREDHNVTVFEADMYIEYIPGRLDTTYQFYLGARSAPAYSFRMNMTKEHFSFIDSSNDTSGISSPAIATASVPEKWFKLRVEFFEGDAGKAKILVYMDGALIYVSRNFYGPKSTDPVGTKYTVNNAINEFSITTWGDTQGIMLLDNVSLYETNLKYPTEPIGAPSGKVYPKWETEDFDAKVLPIKGGANGIITLNTDISADIKTVTVLDRIAAKYDLKADIAVVVDNLMQQAGVGTNTEEKTPNKEIVDFINSKLQQGRLKLMNHGLTHVFWADTETGENIDWEFLRREFIGSRELIRALFPSQRVLTFVLPGYAWIVSQFGEQIYDEVYELLRDEYIADRYYDGTAADIYGWDWMKTPAHQILPDNDAQTFAVIDSVARGEGRFANLFLYHLDEDANFDNGTTNGGTETYFYQRESRLDAIAKRIKAYVDTGAVWQTNYEDAMLYLREAENATLSVKRGENITLVLEDGLDDEIYDYPLSVRLQLDESFEAVKVTQNGRVSYALVKMQNGIYFADLDVIPDSSEAVVERVALEDVPEEFLPATPDAGEENGTIDFDGKDDLDESAWS